MKMKFSPPLHSSEVGEASKEGRASERASGRHRSRAQTYVGVDHAATADFVEDFAVMPLSSGRDGVLSKLFLLNSRSTKTGV